MPIAATTKKPFNLTETMRRAHSHPQEVPALLAAARAAAAHKPSSTVPPVPPVPVTPAPLVPPGYQLHPLHGLVRKPDAPAPEPTPTAPPTLTLPIPAVDADLRAAAALTVGALKASDGRDSFPEDERHLAALARLAAAEDGPGEPLAMMFDAAGALGTYAALVPAADARLTRRVIALAHLDRHGANAAGVPVGAAAVHDALGVSEWRRRRLAPVPLQVEPQRIERIIGPGGVVMFSPVDEPTGDVPAVADGNPAAVSSENNVPLNDPADEPGGAPATAVDDVPAGAVVDDARWLRLRALVDASGGKLTLRDARRHGFGPEEIRDLLDKHPGAGLALKTIAPAKSGGRPSTILVRA